MTRGFSVRHRNTGHWDFDVHEEGRAFRIRGEPGEVYVHDERHDGRPFPRNALQFRSVCAATMWITDELMEDK